MSGQQPTTRLEEGGRAPWISANRRDLPRSRSLSVSRAVRDCGHNKRPRLLPATRAQEVAAAYSRNTRSVEGRIISDIGEAAGIVLDANDLRPRKVEVEDKATGEMSVETAMVPRYATAHDLRRAFGTRWSKRVMRATLQKLMRHASIETTMRSYIQHRADDVSADVWGWADSEVSSVGVTAHENAPA